MDRRSFIGSIFAVSVANKLPLKAELVSEPNIVSDSLELDDLQLLLKIRDVGWIKGPPYEGSNFNKEPQELKVTLTFQNYQIKQKIYVERFYICDKFGNYLAGSNTPSDLIPGDMLKFSWSISVFGDDIRKFAIFMKEMKDAKNYIPQSTRSWSGI